MPSRSLPLRLELPLPQQIRSIQLPTGVRLEYVERGRPDGIPVIVLRGVAHSWRSFEDLLEGLPNPASGDRPVAVEPRRYERVAVTSLVIWGDRDRLGREECAPELHGGRTE